MLTAVSTPVSNNRAFLLVICILSVLALLAIAVGTWSGVARAAYIRAYNKAHGTTLPAGYIAEAAWVFDLRYNKGDFDFFGVKQWEMRRNVWRALQERQADTALERFRKIALLRSIIMWAFGVVAVIGMAALPFASSRVH